ncbi:hypothetical protein [Niabella beijingensis]|uniref:hypothetical protein n=1 Tax=Niabella beijingensis TaxID=2872700 RepID=UPI001CC0C1A6|nr:hypothetical protein [Niabella beijingensis]MBZ4190375.1 hypothetical protein [Niabella beijingensis]
MKRRSVPAAITIAVIFIWVGFVGAISFFESWLKFRAPGVTLNTGLSIGRLVFTTMNRIEWVFLSIAILCTAIQQQKKCFLLALPFLMLLLQTVWLLPALNRQVALYLENRLSGPAVHHILFVIAELIKWLSLLAAGIYLLRRTGIQHEPQ